MPWADECRPVGAEEDRSLGLTNVGAPKLLRSPSLVRRGLLSSNELPIQLCLGAAQSEPFVLGTAFADYGVEAIWQGLHQSAIAKSGRRISCQAAPARMRSIPCAIISARVSPWFLANVSTRCSRVRSMVVVILAAPWPMRGRPLLAATACSLALRKRSRSVADRGFPLSHTSG